MAPLVQVMSLYRTVINPDCSVLCSCVLHHFLLGPSYYFPSYTLRVNCSHQVSERAEDRPVLYNGIIVYSSIKSVSFSKPNLREDYILSPTP